MKQIGVVEDDLFLIIWSCRGTLTITPHKTVKKGGLRSWGVDHILHIFIAPEFFFVLILMQSHTTLNVAVTKMV